MNTAQIESTDEDEDAFKSFFAMAHAARARAEKAREDLRAHLPTLRAAIAGGSGQGHRIYRLALSCWNGNNPVGLCDELCGLDHQLADGVLALIAARLYCGGDADDLIRPLIDL